MVGKNNYSSCSTISDNDIIILYMIVKSSFHCYTIIGSEYTREIQVSERKNHIASLREKGEKIK